MTVNSCLSTIRKQSRHHHESLYALYGLIDRDDSDKIDGLVFGTIAVGIGRLYGLRKYMRDYRNLSE